MVSLCGVWRFARVALPLDGRLLAGAPYAAGVLHVVFSLTAVTP